MKVRPEMGVGLLFLLACACSQPRSVRGELTTTSPAIGLPPPPKAEPAAAMRARETRSRATPSAAAAGSQLACPNDMVLVDGHYCTELEARCLRKRLKRQCAEYEVPTRCTGTEVPIRYCMERYESPNQRGALPDVMVSYVEAKRACAARGRRLCTEAEWTLACEGPERKPYPYGYVRDDTACPIDKPSPRVNERRLFNSRTQQAELDRLDQRDPAGTYARCRSDFGVHDLTGSVDEWAFNPARKPYASSLKGGNWGEYRNACRPVTRGHGPGFRYYQIGYRCCLDPPA